MSLFDWILKNIYVVFVIAFALFSFLGKVSKSVDSNKKRPVNRMPTFGGEVDSQDRSGNASSPQRSSGKDNRRYEETYDDRYDDEQYDERYDQPYSEPAASSRTASDFRSESSPDDMASSVDQQMRLMEEQQRMIQERLNRISSASAPAQSYIHRDESREDEVGTSALRPEDIRTGILWAEVLGSPRSKRPFGTRGKL